MFRWFSQKKEGLELAEIKAKKTESASSEIKIKNPAIVASRPLVTIPNQVRLEDVDTTGQLLIENEASVAALISKLKSQGLNEGVLLRTFFPKLTYDVVYRDDFRGYIYPGILGKGNFGAVRLLNSGKQWFVIKDIKLDECIENEFRLAKKAGLALFKVCDDHHQMIVMQWIPGLDLDKLMKAKITMPLAQRYKITESMFNCVINLHADSLIHSDIKPGNFVLKDSYHVTLVDYGLAIEPSAGTTKIPKRIYGTPQYIAPEAFGKAALMCGVKVDEFSLGITTAEYYKLLAADFVDADAEDTLFWGEKPRLMTQDAQEFKTTVIDGQSYKHRVKLLDLLNKMTAFDPEVRPPLQECANKITTLFQEERERPQIKIIIDVDEINEYLTISGLSKEEQLRFFQALNTADNVLLIENEKPDIIKLSRVVRFLTVPSEKDTELNKVKISEVNLWPEVFFPKGNVDMLEAVAQIPKKVADCEYDCNAYFVYLTKKKIPSQILSGKQVVIMNPEQIVQESLPLSTLKAAFFANLNKREDLVMHTYSQPKAAVI
ncbi:MAG: protein kinase domain-containing protein [Gammaproteobacteria bacterium]